MESMCADTEVEHGMQFALISLENRHILSMGNPKVALLGLLFHQSKFARWVLSNTICNMISLSMDNLFEDGGEEYDAIHDMHKEEGKNRRKLDNQDRSKIKAEMQKHTNPLHKETDDLVNICNGCVADSRVNIHNAKDIGEVMAIKFKQSISDKFYSTLHKEVVTMESMKKCIRLNDGNAVYDREKLFGRLLVLSQTRDISLQDIFMYELAPVPSALFEDYGNMRKSSKAVLIKKLAVESQQLSHDPDVCIFDGNEMLYHIIWPKVG